jgi:hypothetical protein
MTCIDYQIPTPNWVQQQLCTRAERGQTPFVGELRKKETDNFYFILFLRGEGGLLMWTHRGHKEETRVRHAVLIMSPDSKGKRECASI